ncbi:MAG: putative sulfate/molybdate transporter [Promethearchaeota archaeon]
MEKKENKWERKFTLRELGGAFGDWGTLIPFVIGYIVLVGLNPAGIFFCLGITNIILGIRYNLPLPVQPQKTIGTVALAERWNPNLVISTGFGTGLFWAILGFSGKLNKIVKKVPIISVRGIQLGLGFILGWTAILLITDDIILSFISILIIIALIKNQKIPSAILLTGIGIILIIFNGNISIIDLKFNLPEFKLFFPTWENILVGMVIAGIAQLLLTLTNVMIATVNLARDLFPDKKDTIDANSLALNMGVMNLINPFLGGMPLCHGSGGLAAQYAFGARTGGSMILEGLIEIILGLFFSQILLTLFISFPRAILGAMLLYTAVLLGKISFKDFNIRTFPIILISAIICFLFNITLGFLIGLAIYLIFRKNINSKIEEK